MTEIGATVGSPTGYLLSAAAGAGTVSDEALEQVLRVLGADTPVHRISGADDLDAALDALGDRTLVLAGGDGTVHHAVAALAARGCTDRPVGLVPLGTGNDLARALELPVDDPAAAARRVRDGAPRTLDVLQDDAGSLVVNVVHLGVGAAGAEEAADLKGTLGALAYPVGAVQAALGNPGWHLTVELDGQTLQQGRLLQVAVGSSRFVGGGTPLLPDADPSDGLVHLLTSSARGPWARLRYGIALKSGRHHHEDDVAAASGRSVRVVVTGDEPVPVATDGELSSLSGARTWTVRPDFWAALV